MVELLPDASLHTVVNGPSVSGSRVTGSAAAEKFARRRPRASSRLSLNSFEMLCSESWAMSSERRGRVSTAGCRARWFIRLAFASAVPRSAWVRRGLSDAVNAQLVEQRATTDTEQVRRQDAVACSLPQGLFERSAFRRAHRCVQLDHAHVVGVFVAERALFPRQFAFDFTLADARAFAQHHQALDEVLQLPHVAAPSGGFHDGQRVLVEASLLVVGGVG